MLDYTPTHCRELPTTGQMWLQDWMLWDVQMLQIWSHVYSFVQLRMSELIQITNICGEGQRTNLIFNTISNNFTITNFLSNFPPFNLKNARQKLMSTFRVVNSVSATLKTYNWSPRSLKSDNYVIFDMVFSYFYPDNCILGINISTKLDVWELISLLKDRVRHTQHRPFPFFI